MKKFELTDKELDSLAMLWARVGTEIILSHLIGLERAEAEAQP